MADTKKKKKVFVLDELEISDNSKLVFASDKETYIDIRIHIDTDYYKGPTKKGIRMPIERFDEFRKILKKISKNIII